MEDRIKNVEIADGVYLENIKYVILHHQDPNLCASVPLFEKKGLNSKWMCI